MKKKVLILLFCLCMLVVVLPMPASAIGNYGANLDSSCYQNVFSWGQCTWYAWGRAYEKTGTQLYWGNGKYGDAKEWYTNAKNAGYDCDTTPRENSIAVWTGGKYGHVAFVEAVSGNVLYISEANRVSLNYSEGTIDLSTGYYTGTCGDSGHYKVDAPVGYIHLVSSSPSANFVYGIDTVSGGPGSINLKGWLFNKNNITKSIQIHAYIDGGPGSGAPGYGIDANISRKDVDEAYHCGEFHGFDYTITGISEGLHVVQLFAVDQYTSESTKIGDYSVNVAAPQAFVYGIDSVSGGQGSISLKGWVFNRNNITKSVQIHAYMDGGPGSGAPGYAIDANTSRKDVDKAYHCGEFHGFDYMITGISEGTHIVQLFANDQYTNESTKIGDYTVSVAADNQSPIISNISITDLTKDGYTVSCTVTDNCMVSRVEFPTWTVNNGQDDLIWYKGTKDGNVFSCHIDIKNHKNETNCAYVTHIYAWDVFDNQNNVSAGEIIVGTISISVSEVQLNKTELPMSPGQTATLTATVLPATATDPTVTWSTNNPAVATVKGGVVTAVGEGTAIITAKAGDKTATCEVTVKYEYKLGPLTVRDKNGKELTSIPSAPFLVTVPVTKQTEGGDAMVLIASYTAGGQYRGLMYIAMKNVPPGGTAEFTFPVDNPGGDIAVLKAFCIPSFGDLTPMGPASVFPAA